MFALMRNLYRYFRTKDERKLVLVREEGGAKCYSFIAGIVQLTRSSCRQYVAMNAQLFYVHHTAGAHRSRQRRENYASRSRPRGDSIKNDADVGFYEVRCEFVSCFGDCALFDQTDISLTHRENMESDHYKIDLYDLGGGKNIRKIWDRYYAEVHGCIFVVDAADSARMEA